ncbi:flagellar hook protein FlgE [Campylobacter sp. MIT 99-7217]|uniref:flagellar hook-basal body complex protein n=1 Tax=Campylobacter sp. MIT 99-7217 TaxID=535091 RepID=UPI00115B914B|nr:flagellar hook-basal body complex protein [Campylobacter sp. MIT 99-7217]TQR31314.1 flagellar hook protein FlgE [Campylobacter sp. MIT 99-7217]
MTGSFYNGILGVKSQGFGIDVTSNNIANVNTPGFKYSSAEFRDIFYKRIGSHSSNPSQGGLGGTEAASKLIFSQGSFSDTGGEFDVALEGKGFFGVLGSDGNAYYTRNGAFLRDANGDLVDANGNYVLGTMNPNFQATTYSDRVAQLMGKNSGTNAYISSGFIVNNPSQSFSLGTATAQTKLSVPNNIYYAPEVTQNVSWSGNLKSDTRTEVVEIDLDPNDFTITRTADDKISISGQVGQDKVFSAKEGERVILNLVDANGVRASVEAYLDADLNFKTADLQLPGLDKDSLSINSSVLATQREVADKKIMEADVFNADGSRNILRYTLDRVLPQVDDIAVYTITAQMLDSDKNPIGNASTGEVRFNEAGALISNTLTSVANPNGGTINVNLGTPYDPNVIGSGFDGIYMSKTSTQDTINPKSDGFAEGFFSYYDIEKDGSLIATFSNGKTATVGKLALYNFINEQGLASAGNNLFSPTSNSGAASFLLRDGELVYTANFRSKRLEMSNADLSVELTNLIVMQKAYDASSKSITTSDQMIQKAINMKN